MILSYSRVVSLCLDTVPVYACTYYDGVVPLVTATAAD